jgi:hypothetical protein
MRVASAAPIIAVLRVNMAFPFFQCIQHPQFGQPEGKFFALRQVSKTVRLRTFPGRKSPEAETMSAVEFAREVAPEQREARRSR